MGHIPKLQPGAIGVSVGTGVGVGSLQPMGGHSGVGDGVLVTGNAVGVSVGGSSVGSPQLGLLQGVGVQVGMGVGVSVA